MSKSRTWVWLRGLARESGHWGDFYDVFQKAFPADRIVLLDLPGAGNNRHLTMPLDLAQVVDILREQLQAEVDDNTKVHLFTVSLGAMVAMEWMRRYPEDLAGAVLINTSSKQLSPFYHRLCLTAYPQLIKALLKGRLRDREKEVLKLISNDESRHEEVAAKWAQLARERPISYTNFLRQLAAAAQFRPLEKAPEIPVLLLVSLGDRMVEPECSYQLERKFGWDLRSHPWAGHDLTLDDPEWVIDAVRPWLQLKPSHS